MKKYFSMLAVTMLPVLAGYAQTANPPAASEANAPSKLSAGAAEVDKLVKSGVGDEVIQAYVGQSRSYTISPPPISRR